MNTNQMPDLRGVTTDPKLTDAQTGPVSAVNGDANEAGFGGRFDSGRGLSTSSLAGTTGNEMGQVGSPVVFADRVPNPVSKGIQGSNNVTGDQLPNVAKEPEQAIAPQVDDASPVIGDPELGDSAISNFGVNGAIQPQTPISGAVNAQGASGRAFLYPAQNSDNGKPTFNTNSANDWEKSLELASAA